MERVFEPGIYAVTVDILNPCADGRYRGWRRQHVIRKGTRLCVRNDSELAGRQEILGLDYYDPGELTLNPKNKSKYYPLIMLLRESIEREKDSLQSIVMVNQTSQSHVLKKLLKTGVITLKDVRKAVRR